MRNVKDIKKKKDNLVRMTIMLDKKHQDRLKNTRQKEGISYQHQIMVAIDKVMKKKPEFFPGQPRRVKIAFSKENYDKMARILEESKVEVEMQDGSIEEKTIGFSGLVRFALDNTKA